MEIKREMYKKIKSHLSAKEITLIIGPRQVGKTTLAKKLQSELEQENEKVLFLNLDIESDYALLESQEKFLFALRNQVGTEKAYIFIDEFQRKKNGGKFLKGLYDMDLPYKFVITGSGSIELKEEVHESLAGRKRLFELGTLTFSEYINYKTDYAFFGKLSEMYKIFAERVNLHLIDYLTFGGYPKVVLSETIEEKRIVLQEIFSSYLIKDITTLLKVEKTVKFQNLLENLSILDGKLVNISQLSRNIGLSVSTLEKYLWYLEKTFIITPSRPFSGNPLKEINRSSIYYFNDLGLKNLLSNNIGNPLDRLELGFDFQAFVFNELSYKLKEKQPLSLNFWRTKDGAEVDIVVKSGRKIVGVECKYGKYSKPRYTKSMYSFLKKYQPDSFVIVNKNFFKEEQVGKTKLSFIAFLELDSVVEKL